MDELQGGDPRQIGNYALLGRLGAGGMGRVYLGRSRGGRLVAVKVIHGHLAADGEFRVRFAREVEAAQRVSGVFTAPVIDSDANAPLPWLATGYVHGPSVSDAVAAHGALPTSSVLTLAAGLAEGLSAVHAAGVIHRDLKPSNVLLAHDGPRLIDFGISQASGLSPMTRTGMVLGTPGFMSPEQAEGLAVGPASDIFSLGAVLLYVGTATRMSFFAPHLELLSPELRPIVARCLMLDPAKRPSASEFLSELIAAHPGAADQTDWLPDGILPTGTSPLAGRGDRTPSPGAQVAGAQASGAPASAAPVSGAAALGAQASGAPGAQVAGAAAPGAAAPGGQALGAPALGAPVSGAPAPGAQVAGVQVAGAPAPGVQASGAPASGAPGARTPSPSAPGASVPPMSPSPMSPSPMSSSPASPSAVPSALPSSAVPSSPVPSSPVPGPVNSSPEPSWPVPAAGAPVVAGTEPSAGSAAGPGGDQPPALTMQDAWARTRTSLPPTPWRVPGVPAAGAIREETSLATPTPTPAPPPSPGSPQAWSAEPAAPAGGPFSGPPAAQPPQLAPPLTLASLAPDPEFVMTARLSRPAWWRRRRVAWVAAGTVVVLAACGGVYAVGPWRTPPVLRPAGLATGHRTPDSIDIHWSGPSSGPSPDTYVILRDGVKAGTVPGSSTTFDDTGLPPASSHDYRVIAYRSGHRSKSSSQVTAATVTPPAIAGVLDSQFSVSEKMSDGDPFDTSWWQKSGSLYVAKPNSSWTDGWSFSRDSANCDVGPCDVTLSGELNGTNFTMDLSQSGDSYNGSIDVDNSWYCYNNNEYSDTTLQVQLTPESARTQGKTWAAQSFSATATWTIPPDAAGSCAATSFTVNGTGTLS